MQEKRAKRRDIFRSIVRVLETGSYNVHQIKERVEKKEKVTISWEAINHALEVLGTIGYVKKEVVSGRDAFSLKQTRKMNEKTILGLPMNPKAESLCCSLANRIKEMDPKILNTFLQKILIQVIKKRNLDIPYGWYLYGECCVLRLTESCLREYPSTKKYDTDIIEVMSQYKKYPNTHDLRQNIYLNEKNDLYLHQLMIEKFLSKPFEDENKLDLIDLELKQLIWSFERSEDNKAIKEYLMSFYSIFVRLKKLGFEESEHLRLEIYTCFRSVWELIGTYQMFITTKKFYPNQDTNPNFQLAFYQLKNIIDAHLLHLSEHCPPIEISQKAQKLKDSLVKKSQ